MAKIVFKDSRPKNAKMKVIPDRGNARMKIAPDKRPKRKVRHT